MQVFFKFCHRASDNVLPKLRLQFSTKVKKKKICAPVITAGEPIVEEYIPGKSRMGNIVPAGVPSLLPEEEKDWVSPWGNNLPIITPMENPPADWVPPMISKPQHEFGAAIIPKPNGYPIEKKWRNEQAWSIVENSSLLIVIQNLGSMQMLNPMSISLGKKTNGRIKTNKGVQNKFFHFALRFNENNKWQALAPLFQSQCFIAYQEEPDFIFEDLKMILTSIDKLNKGKKPGEESVYVLGGKIGDNLVTSEQFSQLRNFESLEHLKQAVTMLLMRPTNSLIDVLRTPTNGLIRALDYRVKSAQEIKDTDSG